MCHWQGFKDRFELFFKYTCYLKMIEESGPVHVVRTVHPMIKTKLPIYGSLQNEAPFGFAFRPAFQEALQWRFSD